MSEIAGNVIVIGVLIVIVSRIIYSMWKNRRKHTDCSGDCTRCGGCH